MEVDSLLSHDLLDADVALMRRHRGTASTDFTTLTPSLRQNRPTSRPPTNWQSTRFTSVANGPDRCDAGLHKRGSELHVETPWRHVETTWRYELIGQEARKWPSACPRAGAAGRYGGKCVLVEAGHGQIPVARRASRKSFSEDLAWGRRRSRDVPSFWLQLVLCSPVGCC